MACSAPTLDDLLSDPLIQAVMRADHVEIVALKRMLTGVAARQGERALDLSRSRVRFCCQTDAATGSWPAEGCGVVVRC